MARGALSRRKKPQPPAGYQLAASKLADASPPGYNAWRCGDTGNPHLANLVSATVSSLILDAPVLTPPPHEFSEEDFGDVPVHWRGDPALIPASAPAKDFTRPTPKRLLAWLGKSGQRSTLGRDHTCVSHGAAARRVADVATSSRSDRQGNRRHFRFRDAARSVPRHRGRPDRHVRLCWSTAEAALPPAARVMLQAVIVTTTPTARGAGMWHRRLCARFSPRRSPSLRAHPAFTRGCLSGPPPLSRFTRGTRIRARSPGVVRDRGPVSNAARAARTARSMSELPASAARPIGSSVKG